MPWSQALRDMVISSINRGQLPILGFFIVLVALIFRMPADDVSKLVLDIFTSMKHGETISYPLLIASLFGWFSHARWQRKEFSKECARIGKEKSDLQSKLANRKFKSSDKK